VEKLIEERTNKVERTTDLNWIVSLIEELATHVPKGTDGNMFIARELSIILGAWFSRIAWSKSIDKRRPKKDRAMLKEARSVFIERITKEVKRRNPELKCFMSPLVVVEK
jgi:hypothetical protein